MVDYKNIISATYAPITQQWSITDKQGDTQCGTFVDEDNDCLSYNQGDEEWYKTLNLDSEIELVISPHQNLGERSVEKRLERYAGVNWTLYIQYFTGEKIANLSEPQLQIKNS